MQGLAQVPRDPPARARRLSRLGKPNDGPQETPDSAGPRASGGPGLRIPAGTPTLIPAPLGRTVGGWGWGRGRGWRMGRGECRSPEPPSSAHPRVRRDIPPARAAPRSAARRLSPEREPGRGQSAGCFGRSEPRAALEGFNVPAGPTAACRNCSCRRRAQKHFPISRQARRHRPGLARGRAGGKAGPGGGGAAPGQGRRAGGADLSPAAPGQVGRVLGHLGRKESGPAAWRPRPGSGHVWTGASQQHPAEQRLRQGSEPQGWESQAGETSCAKTPGLVQAAPAV